MWGIHSRGGSYDLFGAQVHTSLQLLTMVLLSASPSPLSIFRAEWQVEFPLLEGGREALLAGEGCPQHDGWRQQREQEDHRGRGGQRLHSGLSSIPEKR